MFEKLFYGLYKAQLVVRSKVVAPIARAINPPTPPEKKEEKEEEKKEKE